MRPLSAFSLCSGTNREGESSSAENSLGRFTARAGWFECEAFDSNEFHTTVYIREKSFPRLTDGAGRIPTYDKQRPLPDSRCPNKQDLGCLISIVPPVVGKGAVKIQRVSFLEADFFTGKIEVKLAF